MPSEMLKEWDLTILITHYEAGTAEEIIPRWYKEGYRADALIVDPPRTGLDDKLLDTILTYVPEKWSIFLVMFRPWLVIWYA